MSADPISGIIYPVRSIAPDITASMKPTIDAIGVLLGSLSRFSGTEGVLVGAAPPAGTVVRTQSTTVRQTTDAYGAMTVTLPTAAPNGIVAVSPTNTNVGANLTLTVVKASATLSSIQVQFFQAPSGAAQASTLLYLSLIVTYW